MAVPSLVIGLGGTGVWVLTYLKKNMQETYGKIPDEVRLRAFDTVRSTRVETAARAATGNQQKVEERSVAGVRLEAGEYIHVGGFVRDWVRDIAQDEEDVRFPHLRSWFQAKYYLDNLPDTQFNLDEGAGMFRQLGRLAIFHDLQAATTSKIYGQLHDTISEIQRTTNSRNLQVAIVGSLAGGTGAGMFVDVAHLVRRIADQQAQMQVTVRGFLVLPDAFGALAASSQVKRGMNARAFAAMRENKRFSVSFDWDMGYPLHYKASSPGVPVDPVLQDSLRGQLFDSLYYLDGFRANFPLFSVPVEHGVAPSITDMISAMLDGQSSGAFQEHTRNLQAVLASRGPSRGIPYYGSVGTYSIVFPIYHVVQTYSYRLALETLQQLVQPAEIDERTNHPTRLSSNANEEAGEGYTGSKAARDFMTASSIVDPRNPSNTVDNSLLAPELVDLAERFASQDTSVVDMLSGRSLMEWDRFFAPTGQSEEVLNAKARADIVLNVKLIDEVPPSKDVTPRERPSDGVHRIEQGVRAHKNLYLGTEQSGTGQRIGGKYREALGEYAKVHMNRFKRMLEYKSIEILNGRSTTDAILAKGGKLGYYQEFLVTLALYLDQASQVMVRVTQRRSSEGHGRMQTIASTQNALTEMKNRANDTMPIIGRAHKSQVEYLEVEQSLIDIHKVEIMEQTVAETIRQMTDLVATAQAAVKSWASTLAIGSESLYATLLSDQAKIDANRDKDADVESRLVLGARKAGREGDAEYRRFKEYEKERYEHYVYDNQGNQVNTILQDINWQIAIEEQRGKPIFQLNLTIGAPDSQTAQRRAAEDPVRRNQDMLLRRTRAVFDTMQNTESVLGYLMYAYESPDQLATLVHARSGPLLSHNSEGPIPANYLRVTHGQESGQLDFLRTMLRRLSSLSSISDADKFAKLVNSEDRFTCTLVHTIDLIELDRIRAYENARREYLGYQGELNLQTSQRTILHLFPAEVNAVQLEERLGELNQSARMFDDSVVWQLEKAPDMRLFLQCYAYDMIGYASADNASGETREHFQLEWDPIDDRDTGVVWLTRPSADNRPDILEALLTFNYVGKDVGHDSGYQKKIDYDAVRRTLESRQKGDQQERQERGNLGGSDAAIQGWLREQSYIDQDDQVWLWVARLDRLSEQERRLFDALPAMAAGAKDDPTHQPTYDLMSVFVLTLRDEIARLRRRILNRVPSDEQPKPSKAAPKPKVQDPWRK